MLMHGHQGALPRPEGDPRCYGRFWPADTATRGYPLTPSVPAYKVCQTVFGGRAPGSSAMHLRAGLDEPACRDARGPRRVGGASALVARGRESGRRGA